MALHWAPNDVKYYINGVQFHSFGIDQWFSTVDKAVNPYAPFDQPFHLVITQAIGGMYPEYKGMTPLQASDVNGLRLEVDYVRIWTAPA